MEPIHPLLAPARGGVDQQAARRADDVSSSTIASGSLNGSLGVTTFLKVTVVVSSPPGTAGDGFACWRMSARSP